MKLTTKPDVIDWPVSHYVFVEKGGPFHENAPKAWQELKAKVPAIGKIADITRYTSFYKLEPKMLYRAGVVVKDKPAKLPAGLSYETFKGGKYARFVLTGSYMQLPEACGKVFEIVQKTKLPVRDDFFLENYVNNPDNTPEDKLVTEILVPVK
jgi:predicted transcriptional regulator YdeE